MLRSIAIIISVSSLSACNTGSVLPDSGGGGGSDCSAPATTNLLTGHHMANGAPGDTTGTVTPIPTPHTGCLTTGCHNPNLNPLAPADDFWVYAGEAFKDAAGSMPYAGATILLEALGDTPTYAKLEIASNGFFYMTPGGTFPAPSATQMVNAYICDGTGKTLMTPALSNVQDSTGMTTDGNCNAAACHGPSTTGGFIALIPPT